MSIDEVLGDIFNKGCSPLLKEMTIKEAKSTLLTHLLEKMPKVRDPDDLDYELTCKYDLGYARGQDNIITEVITMLKEELK